MTDVDKFMAGLHNRMPVMLVRGLEDAWPDHEITKAQGILNVLSRSTSLDLDAYSDGESAERGSSVIDPTGRMRSQGSSWSVLFDQRSPLPLDGPLRAMGSVIRRRQSIVFVAPARATDDAFELGG
jgi:hypothetical protein